MLTTGSLCTFAGFPQPTARVRVLLQSVVSAASVLVDGLLLPAIQTLRGRHFGRRRRRRDGDGRRGCANDGPGHRSGHREEGAPTRETCSKVGHLTTVLEMHARNLVSQADSRCALALRASLDPSRSTTLRLLLFPLLTVPPLLYKPKPTSTDATPRHASPLILPRRPFLRSDIRPSIFSHKAWSLMY